MAKFITGNELANTVCKIIQEAKETLMIVSPYIKLGDIFKEMFNSSEAKNDLHIVLVFGKNEGDAGRSLSSGDIDFFKKFPFISIVYVPNLHAKYYGNETEGVITSINLYDYSFKNNIEFGVHSQTGLLPFPRNADDNAWEKCWDLADNGDVVFIKRPRYKRGMFSVVTGKEYVDSKVLCDNTAFYYSKSNSSSKLIQRKLTEFGDEVEYDGDSIADERDKIVGYCIRTRTEIPFNPERPFCAAAYKSWAAYKNVDFKEKYCHKTGEPSNGKTSMRNPVL